MAEPAHNDAKRPDPPLPRLPLWHPSRLTWTIRIAAGLVMATVAIAMWRLIDVPEPQLDVSAPTHRP
ncbi:MAG: hypothetical protein ABI548_17805 [Polyangiaceae bacterium]